MKNSVWGSSFRAGVIWGLGLSVLATIATIHGGTTSLLELSMDFIFNFLFWWLICSLVIRWRKNRQATTKGEKH